MARNTVFLEISAPDETQAFAIVNSLPMSRWIELSDKLPFKQAKTIMKPTATYVASLPNPGEILAGLVNNLYSSKKYKLLGSLVKPAYMAALANDAANGVIDIVIGKAYPLTPFKEAYDETAQGKFVGKVVLPLLAL